jgi:Uncharacterized protein conserved in bacteria (DUF2272)
MSNKILKIVELAKQEWDFFENQEIDLNDNYIKKGKTETDNGYWEKVGEYWRFGVHSNLTGLDTETPWSAAFISYIMRKAELGDLFLYSNAHRDFINKAINAKSINDTNFGFWGHKLTEYKPKIGDLVCYSRQNDVTYETRPNGYSSHSDIVIDIKVGEILVIGGNVKNSVSLKHLKIDANGFLIDNEHKWFVILENIVSVNTNLINYDKSWLKKALEITGDFETSGNPFSGVTGNFDGMGISCGVLQWNIGKESLQPLIQKAGKKLIIKYMPLYGNELWEACSSSKAEGLIIVSSWQKSNVINKIVNNELSNLFSSNELIDIQIEYADKIGFKSFELAVNWAKELYNINTKLQEFCWFFDMCVLNGSLKELWINDVKTFLATNGLDQSLKIIFDWIINYPAFIENGGNSIRTYGKGDAIKNIEVWKKNINMGNIELFILGYLRAQKSKPLFQLVVFNRRSTIAIGQGYVNSEFENFTF